MKPRLIRLSYFAWLVIPASLYLVYLVAGTPYFIFSYSWLDNGTRNPRVERYYTRCTFYNFNGRPRTIFPTDGKCPWVRFFKNDGDA